MKNNTYLTIITLTKNNHKEFLRTLKSIFSQKNTLNIEWLIIDGSNQKTQNKIKELIEKYLKNYQQKNILIKHIDSVKNRFYGIYPCMNYGKKISLGKFIIFLNSGDEFFDNYSMQILLQNTYKLKDKKSLIFGQANIISSKKINWFFPGKRLKNIEKWLNLFEPNHQSMIISKELAEMYDFSLSHSLISDGNWKRKIINNSNHIIYINKPIIKFYLDGASSTKPSKKLLLEIISNKNISIIRKFIFLVKYYIPKKFFIFYHLMQKYKCIFFDLIF
jgi:predicted metal-binding protein